MAKTAFQTVDAYLATLPETTQEILGRVRAIIRKALPDAEEVISYQIPAYKQDGVAVIYFAGWKEHFSLYPVGQAVSEAFPADVAKYSITKGTIRFPLGEKVPAKLIAKIVGLRAKAAAEEARAKKARKAK